MRQVEVDFSCCRPTRPSNSIIDTLAPNGSRMLFSAEAAGRITNNKPDGVYPLPHELRPLREYLLFREHEQVQLAVKLQGQANEEELSPNIISDSEEHEPDEVFESADFSQSPNIQLENGSVSSHQTISDNSDSSKSFDSAVSGRSDRLDDSESFRSFSPAAASNFGLASEHRMEFDDEDVAEEVDEENEDRWLSDELESAWGAASHASQSLMLPSLTPSWYLNNLNQADAFFQRESLCPLGM